MTRCLAAVLLFAMLAAATQTTAQELMPSPPLAPDIAALPRLKGDDAVVSQVNARLQELDERDVENVNCSYDSRPDGPFRTVEVLSDGPEFLSFLIATSTYCEGAAHPWWQQEIINFDLETGEETDLRAFLPPSFLQADVPDNVLAVLFLNTVDDLPGECISAYAAGLRDGWLQFDLGLSEADSALLLWPHGLAYVETPCLDTAFVPLDRLREAGFGDRILQALIPQ